MKFTNYFKHMQDDMALARVPFLLLHIMVFIGTLFVQYTMRWEPMQATVFILIFAFMTTLHWQSDMLMRKAGLAYFFTQAALVVSCCALMPEASPVILLGFMPSLVIEAIYFYKTLFATFVVTLSYASLYLTVIFFYFGLDYLWIYFLIFIVILALLFLVSYLFNQKDAQNVELQYYVEELKQANQKIEQLTLKQERQRMARDLHDTLAQRLVGLILKLEASDAHLQKGNIEKVQTILTSAKKEASESLMDARKAIDDLRMHDVEVSFQKQLLEEIAHLRYTYPFDIACTVEDIHITSTMQQHIVAIVKESMANVHKHAQATQVAISLTRNEQHIQLVIEDNGRGIVTSRDLHKQGHYGMLGMRERAELMHGTMDIEVANGTRLVFCIPTKE